MRIEVVSNPHVSQTSYGIIIISRPPISLLGGLFYFNCETMNYAFGILPTIIRQDSRVSDFACRLFSEVDSLSNKFGYCFATNSALGKSLGKSPSQISRTLSELEALNYINLVIEDGYKRKIYPKRDFREFEGIDENAEGGTQKCVGGEAFLQRGVRKNSNHNKIINKDKPNKIKDIGIDDAPKIILQTISSFHEEVKTEMHKGLSKRFEKHIVSTVLENQIKEFIEYWSVREFRNSRGQKIKSLALTVSTWCKNGDDWGEVRKMYDRLIGGKPDGQNGQIRYSKEEKISPMKYDRVLPTPKINRV